MTSPAMVDLGFDVDSDAGGMVVGGLVVFEEYIDVGGSRCSPLVCCNLLETADLHDGVSE